MSQATSTARRGQLYQWRVRWLGEPDAVAEQLRDIARQGSSMARLAHACAFLLIVLFSAGSLVALGGDALASITTEWQAGRLDIPAAISVGVSTLMVLAMDVGMVYAASMLRLLNSRRAEDREMRVHQLVIGVVAVLEAATYGYMSWRYEHPATWAAWVLIGARALAAPLLSVYLSMARPLPVTSRDILYQAELAAGQGVIRDVVEVAGDAGAPLAEKMALYGAAATMTPHDRSRLDGMIEAVQKRTERPGGRGYVSRGVSTPDRPPTGPGSPTVAPASSPAALPDGGNVLQLPAPGRSRRAAAQGATTQVARGSRRRGAVPQSVEPQARLAWDAGARSVEALQREAGIGRASAQKYAAKFAAEQGAVQVAQ